MLWREVFDTLVQPDCRWAMSVSRSGRTPLPRSIRRLTGRLVVIWTVLAMLVWSVSPVLAEHGGDERDDDSKLEPALERLIYANPAARYKVIVTVAPTRHAQDRRGDQGEVAREIDADGRAEGKVRGRLALINGLAAEMTGSKILALSRHPAVRTIAFDRQVKLFQVTTAPATATPTPTATATNTAAATATATNTASATPTSSPTATPTGTSTSSPTATATGTATATSTPAQTATPTATPSPTDTPSATATGTPAAPTATATSSPTGTATETPAPPTATATATSTQTATVTTTAASPTATPTPAASCPCSLWDSATTPAIPDFPDVSAIELGVRFRADVAGQLTGIRFYKGTLNTGTHVGKLWTETGTLLASATFTKESATGWQEVEFATPVSVAPNTTYVASYYAPEGHYAASGAYFATSGVHNGPLQAPAAGLEGPAGVYLYAGGGGFPIQSYNATNYWVDVVFTPVKSLQTLVSRAPEVWAQADQGQGVTVALLDSGVQPGPDLPDVVAGVDLVGTNTALVDGVGHGTHVAGIIAGSGAMSSGAYRGVAPGARLISVKVANSAGIATYSSIIKGLEWVVANRRAHNIRVVNLSLGASPRGTYKDDPLAAAAEMAWFSGVVVVASAGNHGPAAGTVDLPASDPYVVAVGAADQAMTVATGDDTVPAWSGRGPTAYDGLPKPDLIAGGRRVISLRVPGSSYDLLRPDRVVESNYFRLSGTSMAAPVVSGAAALVLAANPSLTPNQVKYVLTQTTNALGGSGPNEQGTGQLDAMAAVGLARSGVGSGLANRGQRPNNSFARSIYTLAHGAPVAWRDPSYLGRNWSAWNWQTGAWDAATWDNLAWEQIAWERADWTTVTWESLTGWQNGVWVGVSDGALDDGALDDGALDDGALDGTTLD